MSYRCNQLMMLSFTMLTLKNNIFIPLATIPNQSTLILQCRKGEVTTSFFKLTKLNLWRWFLNDFQIVHVLVHFGRKTTSKMFLKKRQGLYCLYPTTNHVIPPPIWNKYNADIVNYQASACGSERYQWFYYCLRSQPEFLLQVNLIFF